MSEKPYIPPELEVLRADLPQDVLLVSTPKDEDYTEYRPPGYDDIIDDDF